MLIFTHSCNTLIADGIRFNNVSILVVLEVILED